MKHGETFQRTCALSCSLSLFDFVAVGDIDRKHFARVSIRMFFAHALKKGLVNAK